MKKSFLAILVLATMGLTALFCFIYVTEDRRGPEIIIPEDNITYKAGDDTGKLLEGVTAKDKRDGDMTETLRIEKIQVESDQTKATVTYVAKDTKNNITKKKRVINNIPEEDLGEKTVQDEIGTDEVSGDTMTNEQTLGQSDGEAANEAAIAALPAEAPRFYLTQYELSLAVGSEFYALDYVKDIVDDIDTIDTLSTRIQIEGEVNTAAAGTYQLAYYVLDSIQNVSNRAILTVTVE